MTTLTDPQQIMDARLLALRQMLKLEILGLSKSKGPSAYSALKMLGYKGTRAEILKELDDWREQKLNG
ncbi:hypothetical protein UFOVP121_71 [uncultured Caudovirales phage]|uniref:Uncharacterized protein n=1 Tax=uncultured Caudovirales phage TaxID=2100421 RepID=A0A6J5LQB6_9CAUD|nr:hypothetical protein UFOVP121_71 [uncultured Caudovirales phage]CAB4135106.1 hypothetical protein UFOVP277_76 [uncultured Caudovirales phage]